MRRIAHISDIHFGAEDPPVVDALRRDLLAGPYDLLVVSGDFTQRARPSQYRAAMAFVRSLPGPQLCVPGNHDLPLYDVLRRFGRPTARYRRFVDPNLTPIFQDGQLLVIGLNTARPLSWTLDGFWKDGRINSRQLRDVRRACEATPDRLFKIVVTHHPFIPPPAGRGHGIVHRARRALRTLEAVGVEALLAGHLHMNYSGDVRSHHEASKRSILSIQAGTACSVRRRGEPNAYNRITVETGRLRRVAARPRDRAGPGVSRRRFLRRRAADLRPPRRRVDRFVGWAPAHRPASRWWAGAHPTSVWRVLKGIHKDAAPRYTRRRTHAPGRFPSPEQEHSHAHD